MTASTGRFWRRSQCVRQQHQRGEANHSAWLCFSHLPVCHANVFQQSSITRSAQKAGRCDSCWLVWPLMFLSAYKLVACGFDDQLIARHASGSSAVVCWSPTRVLCSEVCSCLTMQRRQTAKSDWQKLFSYCQKQSSAYDCTHGFILRLNNNNKPIHCVESRKYWDIYDLSFE